MRYLFIQLLHVTLHVSIVLLILLLRLFIIGTHLIDRGDELNDSEALFLSEIARMALHGSVAKMCESFS